MSRRSKLNCSYNVVQITFSVLYERTLQSKKQQIVTFFTPYKIVKMCNFF